MARESRLEKHEKFILTALSEGKSYVQIAEGLAKKGCETSSVNVFKWVKRRAARILRAAQLVDPLAHAGHLVRTAPVQIQPVQTPAAAPTPEKSTPPAVPAAGAPNAVNPDQIGAAPATPPMFGKKVETPEGAMVKEILAGMDKPKSIFKKK